MRKRYDPALKAKEVHKVPREQKTLADITSRYEIHPNHITRWKREFLEKMPDVFLKKNSKDVRQTEEKEDEFYRQIGQLKGK